MQPNKSVTPLEWHRARRMLVGVLLLYFHAPQDGAHAAEPVKPVGAHGVIGCSDSPKRVSRLVIDKPGIYENYLLDAKGQGGNAVKILADNVTLRNCKILGGSGNGVGVFAANAVIENCVIHHMLAGTFKNQQDAHGITGAWGNHVIRNCDISYVSGDCIQFDPDRRSVGSVLIEDCHLWTGPLPEAAAGFAKGERPGENALDTKTRPDGERCKVTMRNCSLHGWNQPAQIANVAALNLKENIAAEISRCVFRDNEIALRVRGPGKRGGARVSIEDCAIYDGAVGVRIEDKIQDLKIVGLAFDDSVRRKYQFAGGGAGSGYVNENERQAPPIAASP